MGVSYRSSQIGNTVIPKPPGTVTGDLIFISVQSQEFLSLNGNTITAPAGFTDVFNGTGTLLDGSWQLVIDPGSSGFRQFWYIGYKIALPGEPASWTATIHGANPGLAEVQSFAATYQNPDPVTPVLAISAPQNTGSGGLDVPSYSPGEPDSLILDFGASYVGSSNLGWFMFDDQSITAVTDTYSTYYLVPINEPAPGVTVNDLYDPGHMPVANRFFVGSGDGINSVLYDYPRHSAGPTGVHSYPPDGGIQSACVSVALKGSAVLQPTIADCVVTAIAPFAAGGLTLHPDGSFTYNATNGPVFTDHFGYRITVPYFGVSPEHFSTTTDTINVIGLQPQGVLHGRVKVGV